MSLFKLSINGSLRRLVARGCSGVSNLGRGYGGKEGGRVKKREKNKKSKKK